MHSSAYTGAMTQNRMAVDIGGTFTDAVLQTAHGLHSTKVLTTPASPETGMLQAIEALLAESGLRMDQLDVLIHGTTLATNALIERKGAATACLVNEGFRDVLETGHEKRFDHYDLNIEMPRPLVPRWLRLPVRGRMRADGREHLPLRLEDVDQACEVLEREGIQSVAIGLLHAYANPAHEQAVAERLQARLPGLSICLSSQVCPEIREYERLSTTVANAYVRPMMKRYLEALSDHLASRGLRAPIFLVTSGGGLTTIDTASRFPIRLVESGPAGGAILAGHVARSLGLTQALSFDMGGTTAKICFISDGQAEHSRRFEVARAWKNLKGSGLPIRIPVTEMVEIGAGGGSIAAVDRLGRVTVGPHSAASVPGPACYQRGGTHPTVTDAQLCLGRLDPQGFAGGRMALSEDHAHRALMNAVGTRQGLDAAWSACAVIDMVEENMAAAARVHAIERGKTTEQATLIAFGGAAPLHAASLAMKLGMRRAVVPHLAGVGSALGFLLAPVAYQVVRSLRVDERAPDLPALSVLLAGMDREAVAIVAAAAPGQALGRRFKVEARYQGQGHEISLDLPGATLDAHSLAQLRKQFEQRYQQQFGLLIEQVPLEFLTWSLEVTAPQSAPQGAAPAAPAAAAAAQAPVHAVFDTGLGRFLDHARWRRDSLTVDMPIEGPALIIEDQTTTVVPRHWRACLQTDGHLLLEQQEAIPQALASDAQPRAEGLAPGSDAALQASDIMREQVRRQILWNRLVAVVEEGAQVLLRTAFGAVTREAGDLSAGVYDQRGRMIAQAVTGTPGHVNTMATAVGHFLERYPLHSMKPGDVFVTNDPWCGTGHLFDFVVVTPVFRNGQAQALVASTCHVIDIGGRGFTADARSVYEEGLWVPHLPLFSKGVANETLLQMIARNVREPLQVRGDLMSLVACNAACAKRLVAMLDEFALPDLEGLSNHIIEVSRQAMRQCIAALEPGRWQHRMRIDGYDQPVDLVAAITIDHDHLTVDFEGTSPASAYGINSPKCYADAYAVYGIKCVIAPDIPNNAGSLDVIEVRAPQGCIVNPLPPAPVTARHVVGQMLPELMFGCLEAPLKGQVPAEGAGSIWVLALSDAQQGPLFNVMSIGIGGMGARPGKDGLSATAYPSGVGMIPIEITEADAPLLFLRRELLPGSAGAGRYRGGHAPLIEVCHRDGLPFHLSAATFDRREHPARGRAGAPDARAGECRLSDGSLIRGKGKFMVPAGQSVILRLPGGAGLGAPEDRDPAARAQDQRDGMEGIGASPKTL